METSRLRIPTVYVFRFRCGCKYFIDAELVTDPITGEVLETRHFAILGDWYGAHQLMCLKCREAYEELEAKVIADSIEEFLNKDYENA